MKGVQCYELFGGIALKIHTFSFFINAKTSVQSQYPKQFFRIFSQDNLNFQSQPGNLICTE